MQENKIFPKVLFISTELFGQKSGTEVTFTNLFSFWPKEKLAIAGPNIDIAFCESKRPCHSYFDFKRKGGKVVSSIGSTSSAKVPAKRTRSGIKAYVYSFITYVLLKTGIQDFLPWHLLSKDFLDFYDTYNPDIVYFTLGSISSMKFVINLKEKKDCKVAIHICDDWLVGNYNYRWFPGYWKRKAAKLFNEIVKMADCHIATCQEMAKEYEQRYHHSFYSFHNPVDIKAWESIEPINKDKDLLSIVYLGKIGRDTINNLIDLSEAVEKMDFPIHFDIYTPAYSKDKIAPFSDYKCTYIHPNLPHDQVFGALASASLLFLPLDFSYKSIQYTRLSMPTKLTEYMLSRTPILLYCPKELALYKYLKERDAAIFCEKGVENLCSVLSASHYSTNDIDIIAQRAYNDAINNHSLDIVCERFRTALLCNNIIK